MSLAQAGLGKLTLLAPQTERCPNPAEEPLSYTKFQYENISLSPSPVQGGTFRIELDLANTGARAGAEVVQVYVRPPRGPKKVLRAFRRVTLDADKREHIAIDLAVGDLSHYDAEAKRDIVDPGATSSCGVHSARAAALSAVMQLRRTCRRSGDARNSSSAMKLLARARLPAPGACIHSRTMSKPR